jgi:PAS domain S-box-containing protein
MPISAASRDDSIGTVTPAPRRQWTIQHRIAAAVLVTALPLTLLLAAAIWHMALESTDAQRQGLLYSARALAAAVDARIDKHTTLGRALATSPALLDNDLSAFETDARRTMADVKDTWLVVADLEGQQLVNTLTPRGTPLPRRNAAAIAAQQKAFEQNAIVISDASYGPISRRLYASIHFPIRRDGKPFRDLAIPMMAEGFLEILKVQSIPDGRHASVADSQGVIIARLPHPERLVGHLVAESHRPYIGQTGIFEWTSLEGERVVAAGIGTANGWTATVGITRSAMFAEVWHDVRWISLTALAVILASVLAARWIGGGIIRPIKALSSANASDQNETEKRWVASLPEAAAVAQQLAQATDRLAHSKARLRLALEAAEAGTWEADLKTGRFVASDRALALHGLAPGTITTVKDGLSTLLPEDQRLVEEAATETYKTGKPFNVEVRSRHPDGSVRWLSSRGARRDGPDGRLIVGLVQDVTERRNAENILREHDSRLETVFDSLPIGVGMVDASGRRLLANREMQKLLPNGLLPSYDSKIRSSWRGYHPDGTLFETSDFPGTRALRGERVVPGVEMVHTDDDGRETWFNIAAAPIHDAHGNVYAAFGAVSDITERKRDEQRLADLNRELEARVDERTRELQREMRLREDTQAQLAQSQRLDAIGKLTGGIAHDFNNLLTVIIGNLELAELHAPQDELKALIQQAMAAAEAGVSINRRLLSFARRQMLSPQRINPNDRVLEMHQILRPSLGERIKLATHVEPGLWATMADPGEIDSAIVNIAVNARDAMPDGGTLTIRTRNVNVDDEQARRAEVSPGRYVGISVEDSGHGMSPEVLKRAMEPFFTTKETGKGSGLGLSSVYGFLRQSKGYMEIDSKPGHGTVVSMYLPQAPEEGSGQAAASVAHPRRGSGELILLVEDNDIVRETARMNLQSLGYRVIEAPNAVEARAILSSADGIRLVFSDVVMPGGMSGYDLAEWLRTEKPDIKVLLASGHNDVALDERLRSTVRLLGKPYRRSQFAQALSEMLGKPIDPARDDSSSKRRPAPDS